jgi:hypothetical protein
VARFIVTDVFGQVDAPKEINLSIQVARFIVTDVFGQTVIAIFASWDHVTLHAEMIGKEDQVKAAIETPDTVYEGRTPEHKLLLLAISPQAFGQGVSRSRSYSTERVWAT